MARRCARVARDAARLLGNDREATEARVHVHERRERTEEATPDAAREPEVESVAENAAEEDVDRPLVVLLEPIERRVRPVAGWQDPTGDAHREQQERQGEHPLSREGESIPARPVRHAMTNAVPQRFRERAARTDPSAIGALAEEVDGERDPHEGL